MTLTPIQDLPIVELGLYCHKPTDQEARERLAAIDGRRWAVLDFETASKHHPLVVEVGLVASDGTVLLETLVDPGIPITQFVRDIHGISDADVRGAPTWPKAQEQMAKVLHESGIDLLLAYNAAFEGMCLQYNANAWSIEPLDVELECLQEIACGLLGYKPGTQWLSLRTACEMLGVERTSGHRAVVDCQSTLPLVEALRLVSHGGGASAERQDV